MKRVVIGSMLDRSILAIAAALVFGTLTLSATTAGATSFDDKPKILLHLKALTTKNMCTTYSDLADCTTAITRGALATPGTGPFYFAFVEVANANYRNSDLGGNNLGIAGVQFGINYNNAANTGVDVFTWNLCATLEFVSTGWPAAGGGNLITWDSTNKCQKGEVSIAGYFYCGAYTADRLALTARPVDGNAKVADCNSTEILLNAGEDLGFANFTASGEEDGCNPCISTCITPVKPTTWSQIKGSYRSR